MNSLFKSYQNSFVYSTFLKETDETESRNEALIPRRAADLSKKKNRFMAEINKLVKIILQLCKCIDML